MKLNIGLLAIVAAVGLLVWMAVKGKAPQGAKFKVGDLVRVIDDPGSIGTVLEVVKPEAGLYGGREWSYNIQFSRGVSNVQESRLRLA